MRIAYLEVENFRGVKTLKWAPSPGMNCLIGPGDSTKTTVLDAIELCLNPRSYIFADDCDFFDLDIKAPICCNSGSPAEPAVTGLNVQRGAFASREASHGQGGLADRRSVLQDAR
nr:AAA family ATPase [Bradyrhizobium diazoefficiens]